MRAFSNILVSVICFADLITLGQSLDVQRVYSSLQNIKGKLTGYQITARETNVILNHIVPGAEARAKLSDRTMKILEKLSRLGAVTNIAQDIYTFGGSAIFLSREQFNLSGKVTQKRTVLATSNEVLTYYNPVNHKPIERVKGVGIVHNGSAEIRTRKKYDMFGVPEYLSELTLRDVLDSAPSRSCVVGESLAGQNCYVITVPGESDTPIKKYKLFLRSDTLVPVEFNGYLADGTMYFRADLYFEQPPKAPFLCTKADVQVFVDGKLHIRSVWTLENVEKLRTALSENVDSFIPPGTSVMDSRFPKLLSYPMGAHPPTPAQIDLMLKSPTGVASYEAGIVIPAQSIQTGLGRRKVLMRIILSVIFISPMLILLFRVLKRATK